MRHGGYYTSEKIVVKSAKIEENSPKIASKIKAKFRKINERLPLQHDVKL